MRENMSVTTNDIKLGVINFTEVGDTLPEHNHTEENVHITVVCRGSVQVLGPLNRIAVAGDVIDWQPYQSHGFVALEPNTKVINILKVY